MNRVQYVSTFSASSLVTENSSNNTNQDFLVRYQDKDGIKTLTTTETQIIRDGLNAYHYQHGQDIVLLRSVILWQRNNIDYNGLYTAFLLGCLSEEEFEEESEKFTIYEEFVDPIKKIKFIMLKVNSCSLLLLLSFIVFSALYSNPK